MKRKIVIAAVTASLVIGGGAAVAFADDEARTGGAEVHVAETDDSTGSGGEAVATHTTAADAIAAALEHTPGTAVAADRDDDGAGAWEVDVVKGDGAEHTVRVSPDTGKVLGAHRDTDDDGRDDLAVLKGTSVDVREAALAVAPKGTVTDVDLDDDGPAAWSVETAKGEWRVDAHSGKVMQDRDASDHADRNDQDGDDD
ncbi:PepSY domain-containing protein [Streptomyces sp. NPDC047043]|uniref:PepSY domain-containing protein n=1 Tax=Streptomyces sp. NPDC047043 TaxID=3154497 RepID=UPI00340D6823